MRILIDVDDTIEYLLPAWITYLNNKYDFSVKLSDCHGWDMGELFPTLSREQICSALGDTELWKTVQPIPGAIETVKRLQDDGHDIVLVTASTYFDVHDKIKYVIDKYFPFISHENIIVAFRKQLIIGDVLIDDYVKNLEGGTYKKILFTSQHNLGVDVKSDIRRANNWDDVYQIIEEFKIAMQSEKI